MCYSIFDWILSYISLMCGIINYFFFFCSYEANLPINNCRVEISWASLLWSFENIENSMLTRLVKVFRRHGRRICWYDNIRAWTGFSWANLHALEGMTNAPGQHPTWNTPPRQTHLVLFTTNGNNRLSTVSVKSLERLDTAFNWDVIGDLMRNCCWMETYSTTILICLCRARKLDSLVRHGTLDNLVKSLAGLKLIIQVFFLE